MKSVIVTNSNGLPEFSMNVNALDSEAFTAATRLIAEARTHEDLTQILGGLVEAEAAGAEPAALTIARLVATLKHTVESFAWPLLDIAEAAQPSEPFRENILRLGRGEPVQ